MLKNQTNHFVAVEANIAAGKSTLLPQLATELGWEPLKEPVDDPRFTELLEDFTKHPHDANRRIRFQKYITERRAGLVTELDTSKNYLIERSLYSDLIFSQANFLSMEQPNAMYMDYYYDIKRRLLEYPRISAVVYLRTTPEVAYGRLISRGREAENGTPLSYIQDLHNFHEACLPQICREMKTPLIELEWDNFGCEKEVAQMILDIIAEEKARDVA
ncbi:deoxynucleoside kinase [Parendozoicomonas haliclonae]|uniref:Deoxyadenosine/deoxycytidine kinase n=1 Tax=Parendozoicomonas haliclonae TaxID=1960125 RepID=A0A1X7ALS3_9GAMM|nr:deoxynucleoside kinase [Parendozoicomonas haliclonae]SMA48989.1 Deoxyadenosine/deoxycytidine kinase [Parendozoicomonas haliclonae]